MKIWLDALDQTPAVNWRDWNPALCPHLYAALRWSNAFCAHGLPASQPRPQSDQRHELIMRESTGESTAVSPIKELAVSSSERETVVAGLGLGLHRGRKTALAHARRRRTDGQTNGTNRSREWPKLTKPVYLNDCTCASWKINGGMWLKLFY